MGLDEVRAVLQEMDARPPDEDSLADEMDVMRSGMVVMMLRDHPRRRIRIALDGGSLMLDNSLTMGMEVLLLARALERSPAQSISELHLSSCGLSAEALRELLRAVRVSGQHLQCLWLFENPLGVEGASVLRGLLAGDGGRFLSRLSCSCCGLGDQGARILAEGIRASAVLSNLYVWGNGFTRDGAIAIIDAVAVTPHVNDVDLADLRTRFGSSVLRAMIRCNMVRGRTMFFNGLLLQLSGLFPNVTRLATLTCESPVEWDLRRVVIVGDDIDGAMALRRTLAGPGSDLERPRPVLLATARGLSIRGEAAASAAALSRPAYSDEPVMLPASKSVLDEALVSDVESAATYQAGQVVTLWAPGVRLLRFVAVLYQFDVAIVDASGPEAAESCARWATVLQCHVPGAARLAVVGRAEDLGPCAAVLSARAVEASDAAIALAAALGALPPRPPMPAAFAVLAAQFWKYASQGRVALAWDETQQLVQRCGLECSAHRAVTILSDSASVAVVPRGTVRPPLVLLRPDWIMSLLRAFGAPPAEFVRGLRGLHNARAVLREYLSGGGRVGRATIEHICSAQLQSLGEDDIRALDGTVGLLDILLFVGLLREDGNCFIVVVGD